jgi:hypothetical protein
MAGVKEEMKDSPHDTGSINGNVSKDSKTNDGEAEV